MIALIIARLATVARGSRRTARRDGYRVDSGWIGRRRPRLHRGSPGHLADRRGMGAETLTGQLLPGISDIADFSCCAIGGR